jgi:outer membrane protein TolC
MNVACGLLLTVAWGAELTLDEVLAVVDDRVPALSEAISKQRAAEGKAMASRGAFDPKLKGKGKVYSDDPYDRTLMEGYLSARAPIGAELEGGWRYGVGEFPSYDGAYTGKQGELFVGAELDVLDGLLYGEERVVRDVADAMLLSATADLDLKRIEARRKATETYWKWVAAGRGLAVEEAILQLAEQRVGMLRRQEEEGSRPRFDVLDNERVLFERREAVIAAQQKLQVAGVELSLWWRDERGDPQVPERDRLPQAWTDMPETGGLQDDLERSLGRPDIAAVQALRTAVEAERRRAGNARLPDLTVGGEVNRDLEKEKTEFIGQLELGSSLLLRKERGAYDAAAAELMRVEARLRGTRDRVRADVLAAHAVRDTAMQRVEAARGAADRAAEVVQMERRRMELGSTDLFQLLLREDKLEKARKNLVDAELQLRLAEAAVQAAVGVLETP